MTQFRQPKRRHTRTSWGRDGVALRSHKTRTIHAALQRYVTEFDDGAPTSN
jgi:hypothetical protein